MNRQVDRDLATICLKCLSKDPGRRYASAAELAEELSRFLAGYPIKARPVTQSERIWLWCRRNPMTAGQGIAALMLLLATATIATLGYLKETRLSEDLEASLDKKKSATEEAKRLGSIAATERDNAITAGNQAAAERTKALLSLANAYFDRASVFFDKGEIQSGLLFLVKSLKVLPPENMGLAQIIRRNIASWSDQILAAPVHHFDHSAIATCASYVPNGNRLAVGCRDGSIVLWDVYSGEVQATKMSLPDEIWKLKVSRDGMKLIAGCMNGTARLWNLSAQKQIGPDVRHTDRVSGLAFSPDSRFAVTGSWDRTTRYLSTETGMPVHDSIATSNHVGDMEFSPDGKFVIASDAWLSITVREFETGNPVRHLNQTVSNSSLTISQDGRLMAMGTRDNIQCIAGPFEYLEYSRTIQVDRAAALLAVGGGEWNDPKGYSSAGLHRHHIRVWSILENRAASRIFELPYNMSGAAFSPDSRTLLTTCMDGNLRAWNLGPQPGTPAEIEAWIELLTGMFLDSRNAVQFLDRRSWSKRQQLLKDSPTYLNRLTELSE